MNFNELWDKICVNEGKTFTKIKGEKFTYNVKDNKINPSCADFSLTKDNFEKAFYQFPVSGPSYFSKDIMGTSYVWAILNQLWEK